MRDIIIAFQSFNTCKSQLTNEIGFISSKDNEEQRVMNSISDNIKFTLYNDVNEVVNDRFESLCSKYQDNSETSMIRSDATFDSVQLMYYRCHKINFKHGGSYIDSPDWIKKGTKNPKNKHDKCLQYAANVATLVMKKLNIVQKEFQLLSLS